DREVVSKWYMEYRNEILKYINSIIHDYHQAEDLTQDTFCKALVSFDKFKGNCKPTTWLYTLARNSAIDYLRKRKPSSLLENITDNLSNDSMLLPEYVAERKENLFELYEAMNKLKSSYKIVVYYR
ncbi:RNA polymerase sigma factor, partial [Pseudomonas sp. 2822-17]|uniref:RNA polymerase sigma factor n=1 Tax=Pseudomonas sp. 2822-17 TaxID=1712678 RepID=UPI000C160569